MAGLSPQDRQRVNDALIALRDSIEAQTLLNTTVQRWYDETFPMPLIWSSGAGVGYYGFEALPIGYLRASDSNARQIAFQCRVEVFKRVDDPFDEGLARAAYIPDLDVLLDPTLYRDIPDIVTVGDEFGLNAPERGDMTRDGDVLRCLVTAQFAIAVGPPPDEAAVQLPA